MADQILSAKRLRELLSYDPETGLLAWFIKPVRRSADGAAGYIDKEGYRKIRISGSAYYAHRLAWLYTYGEWPKKEVDHKNGTRSDNRIANLRDVNHSENQQNLRQPRKGSAVGYLGVWVRANGRFMASVKVDGKTTYLGGFDTAEGAYTAYIEKKRILHKACTI